MCSREIPTGGKARQRTDGLNCVVRSQTSRVPDELACRLSNFGAASENRSKSPISNIALMIEIC